MVKKTNNNRTFINGYKFIIIGIYIAEFTHI